MEIVEVSAVNKIKPKNDDIRLILIGITTASFLLMAYLGLSF